MRTVHKTTAIVAALGIAFGVTACGTESTSVNVASKSTVTTTPPTTTPTTTAPTPKPTTSVTPVSLDVSLKMDLKNMATDQETWLTDNPTRFGIAVTATKPGGTAKIGNDTFHASPGNVIAVTTDMKGYCISGYNKAAAKATSATKSFVYKSDKGGLQAALGACSQSGALAAGDVSLKMDLKNMATLQETWLTDNVTSSGVAVTATKPGGTAKVGNDTFHASPGNVIAVKVLKNGYCISGYNRAATKATSATKSLLYKSEKGGIQAGVGAC